MRSRIPRIGSRAAVVAALLGVAWWLRRSDALPALLERLEALGPSGAVAFVGLHALSTVCFLPSLLPTFAAGLLYGLGKGFLLSLVGAGLGAVAALWIGRHLARTPLERRFGDDRRFRLLDDAVRRRGWRVVVLARLSPIFPFSIGNYLFGLSRIPASRYGLASMLGTMPSNGVYVYLGTVSGGLAALQDRGAERTPAEWGLLGLGLVATVALAVTLRRVAERGLASDLSDEN